MGTDVCFLITILYGDELIQCAMKCDKYKLGGDIAEHPMEPENREALHSLLPLHVRSCGPIVAVSTDLFEIHECGK